MIQNDEITLDVATPAGTYSGAFPQNTKVDAVIAAIVKAKALDAGKKYQLFNGDEQLPPQYPLVSFHLGDHASLRLFTARGHGDEIILHVSTPAGAFHRTFLQTASVAEVIAHVAKAKELDTSENFKLYHEDDPLAPERTLASYQFGDEASLTLLATGSGV